MDLLITSVVLYITLLITDAVGWVIASEGSPGFLLLLILYSMFVFVAIHAIRLQNWARYTLVPIAILGICDWRLSLVISHRTFIDPSAVLLFCYYMRLFTYVFLIYVLVGNRRVSKLFKNHPDNQPAHLVSSSDRPK